MQIPDTSRTGADWRREALAGTVGALATLPVVLTLGLLAFSSLGTLAPQVGLLAAFITSSLGASVHAALARSTMPTAGPSSATSLTLATLVVELVADPAIARAGSAGVSVILVVCGVAVLLCGVLQIGLAYGSATARLSRLAPQPVLAGFMNSAALLVLLSQLPLLLDVPPGAGLRATAYAAANPWALAAGLGTAASIWYVARRWPRLPAALLGLAAGTAAHALADRLGAGLSLGALVGPLQHGQPWPPAMFGVLQPAVVVALQAHAGSLVVTALALAALSALESSLNVRSIDQMLGTRHDPKRELVALGCANIACGLFGGLPISATRTRALATLQAGGRGRGAALMGAATLGLLYLAGGPLIAVLPLPVLAGVMLTVAWGLADRWTGRLVARWWAGDHSRELALGLGVVGLVVATTLWKGMPAGVGVGVLLSLATFALRMKRSLVHDRYLASARPSRRTYPAPVEARLRPLRAGIAVLEVEGALFFGSGDRLLDEADQLGAACRCLVLDLRRVVAIDELGAVALQSTVARALRGGVRVELAGLADGSPPARALQTFAPSLPHWPDADRAIEASEHYLLAQLDGDADVRAMAEIPLAQATLLAGLDAAQVAHVAAHLTHRRLESGEALFLEGDPGDCLYVVTRGSVSVLSLPDLHGRTQRYLSVSPGMMIGETAMLDGGGRSAAAVADAPTEVYALSLDALDVLGRSHPELAIRLHRNIARHLSQLLRGSAGAWRAGTG